MLFALVSMLQALFSALIEAFFKLFGSRLEQDRKQCIFRITGPASVKRLTPLMRKIDPRIQWTEAAHPNDKVPRLCPLQIALHSPVLQLTEKCEMMCACVGWQIDFCWETTCEKLWERAHAAATVRSKLHFSQVSACMRQASCVCETKMNVTANCVLRCSRIRPTLRTCSSCSDSTGWSRTWPADAAKFGSGSNGGGRRPEAKPQTIGGS